MDEPRLMCGLPDDASTQTKEVKMQLPLGLMVRLHGTRILTGVTISETVTGALDAYFAQASGQRVEAQTPVAVQTAPPA